MPPRRPGPTLTRPAQGWISRADVTVNLAEIEAALKAGETKVSIWRALFIAKKVRCSYNSFVRRLNNVLATTAMKPAWTPQPRAAVPATLPTAPALHGGSETARPRTFRPNPTPDIDSIVGPRKP